MSHGVAEPIEVNVVALRASENSDPVVLISMDSLYPGRLIRDVFENCLSSCAPEQIFLGSSHTHSAPMIDDTKPRLGALDTRYLSELTYTLRDTFGGWEEASGWRTVDLEVGRGEAQHSINRRRRKRLVVSKHPRLNDVVNAPNPSGFTDESIVTFVARDQSGAAQFVVWNYACHPVAFPDPGLVSAHFPHLVRQRLRRELGDPALPVLFFQGFSGNTRPSASVQLNGWRSRLLRLVVGPMFSNLSWSHYRMWSESLAEVVLTATQRSTRLIGDTIFTKRVLIPSERLVSGAPETSVSFHSVTIGDGLCLAGVSAEVVAEYAPVIREGSGFDYVMCVGCLDHTVGYVPTAQILSEGGYESGGYCAAFGLGKVAPDVETQFLSAFSNVL